jgi:hypothetical protein
VDQNLGTMPPDPALTNTPVGPWPVYATNEPSTPDNCITVVDTEAQDDGREMTVGEALYHYGIQVMIRSTDHPSGYQKAMSILNDFAQNVYNASINIGSNHYWVHCISRIRMIDIHGKDNPNTKRSRFSLNCLVALQN